MADVIVQDSSLQSIADAIRAKTGGTDTYKPSEMAAAIEGIETGGGGNTIVVGTENLHDTGTDIANVYLENGVEVAYSGWSATDYIQLESGITYAVVQLSDKQFSGLYCCFFNSQKSYLGIFTGGMCTFESKYSKSILLFSGIDGFIRLSAQSTAVKNIEIYKCNGTFEFETETEQSAVAVLSDDIPAEITLDILTGGGPEE